MSKADAWSITVDRIVSEFFGGKCFSVSRIYGERESCYLKTDVRMPVTDGTGFTHWKNTHTLRFPMKELRKAKTEFRRREYIETEIVSQQITGGE